MMKTLHAVAPTYWSRCMFFVSCAHAGRPVGFPQLGCHSEFYMGEGKNKAGGLGDIVHRCQIVYALLDNFHSFFLIIHNTLSQCM